MAYVPAISRLGLVEQIEAKLYARFGAFSDAYLTGMLRGKPPPKHVYAEAERLKKERFWEQPDRPAPAMVKKESTAEWWKRVDALAPKVVVPVKSEEPDKEDFWDKIMSEANEQNKDDQSGI